MSASSSIHLSFRLRVVIGRQPGVNEFAWLAFLRETAVVRVDRITLGAGSTEAVFGGIERDQHIAYEDTRYPDRQEHLLAYVGCSKDSFEGWFERRGCGLRLSLARTYLQASRQAAIVGVATRWTMGGAVGTAEADGVEGTGPLEKLSFEGFTISTGVTAVADVAVVGSKLAVTLVSKWNISSAVGGEALEHCVAITAVRALSCICKADVANDDQVHEQEGGQARSLRTKRVRQCLSRAA